MALQVLTGLTLGAMTDVTAYTDIRSVLIKETGYAGIATADFTLIDPPVTPIQEWMCRILDGGTKAFEGKIKNPERTTTGLGPTPKKVFNINAHDNSSLLADDVVDDAAGLRSTVETDAARVIWLISTYSRFLTAAIPGSGGFVTSAMAGNMPTQDLRYLNLWEALEEIAKVTGGKFYVDYDAKVHYFSSESTSAPFHLSNTPNNTTTFGYTDLILPADTYEFCNAVLVVGAEGTTPIWRPDPSGWPTASHTTYGRRENVLRLPEVTDLTMMQRLGDAYIGRVGVPKQSASLKVYRPGLRAGQNIQLTNSLHGLSAVSFPIVEWSARPILDDRNLEYTVMLGSRKMDLSDVIQQQDANTATAAAVGAVGVNSGALAIADLSIGGANLVPNSSFEDGTSWVVGAQWTIGFTPGGGQLAAYGLDVARGQLAAQTAGDLVTPKINIDRTADWVVSFWRYVRSRTAGTFRAFIKEYNAANTLLATTNLDVTAADSGWTRVVQRFGPVSTASDVIAFQATTAKVEIGFNTAGASATMTVDVDGVQLERGNIVTAYAPAPQELVAGSIGTTQIADDAITTPKLVAGAVTTAKVAADAITANELAAGSVTADAIAAGAVRIGNLADDPGGNLVTNFGFEADGPLTDTEPTGWALSIGSLANFDVIATTPSHGAHVLRITGVSGAVQQLRTKDAFAVQGGQRYRVGAWMRGTGANTAAAQGRVVVYFFDSAGTQISATELAVYTMGTSGTLLEQAAEIVAPTTAVTAKLGLRTPTTVATGDQVFFDDAFMYRADRDVIHAAGNVRIDSTGVAITNGAMTVQNAGATVIIDGTSNMFKILATGTQTLAWPAVNGSAATGVVLSGLGTFTAVPIVFSSVTTNASVSTQPRQSQTAEDVDTASGIFNDRAYTQFRLDSGNILVTLSCESNNVKPVGSAGQRYYVCKEAAI